MRIGIAFLLTFCVSVAFAGTKTYLLKYADKPGNVRTYDLTMSYNVASDGGDTEEAVPQSTSVNWSGRVTETIRSCKLGLTEINFNFSDVKPAKAEQIVNDEAGSIKLGSEQVAPFSLRYSRFATGVVKQVGLIDGMLPNDTYNPPMTLLMQAGMVTPRTVELIFPNHPVKVGESWSERIVDHSSSKRMEYERKYTLVDAYMLYGNPMLEITCEVQTQAELGSETMALPVAFTEDTGLKEWHIGMSGSYDENCTFLFDQKASAIHSLKLTGQLIIHLNSQLNEEEHVTTITFSYEGELTRTVPTAKAL